MKRDALNKFVSTALTSEYHWLHDPETQEWKAGLSPEQRALAEQVMRHMREATANILKAVEVGELQVEDQP